MTICFPFSYESCIYSFQIDSIYCLCADKESMKQNRSALILDCIMYPHFNELWSKRWGWSYNSLHNITLKCKVGKQLLQFSFLSYNLAFLPFLTCKHKSKIYTLIFNIFTSFSLAIRTEFKLLPTHCFSLKSSKTK